MGVDVLPWVRVSGDARLDGHLAMMVVQGVEIGAGFELGRIPDGKAHDEIFHDAATGYYRRTNRSGGIEGSMAAHQPGGGGP